MNYTILIIEDNSDIRNNVSELLKLEGYNTISASNGRQGLAMALDLRPDLILCDILIPELDGYELLQELNRYEVFAQIPFIYLTALTEKVDFSKGLELGADYYLAKPFDDVELMQMIKSALRKRDMGKEYGSYH